MKIPSDSSANIHSTRSSVLQALGLRPGQSFSAQVMSNSPDGLTQLKVGSQQVSLNLPSKPQIGVMLQFLFKSGGKDPQIILMGEVGKESKTTQPNQNLANSTSSKSTVSDQALNINISTQANSQQSPTAQKPQTPIDKNQQMPQNSMAVQTPQSTSQNNLAQAHVLTQTPIQSTSPSIVLPQAITSKLQLLSGQTVNATVTGQAKNGQVNFTIGQQIISAPIAGNPPIGSNLQFLVHVKGGQARLVLSEPLVNLNAQTQAKSNISPNLNQQTNYYNQTTNNNSSTNNSQQNLSLNIAASAPKNIAIPSPIALALSSAIPASLARQDSIGALFANLMNLQKNNSSNYKDLPKGVKNAAQTLLNSQLKLDGKPATGATLKAALSRSGLFLESFLAGKTQALPAQMLAAQSDMKSLLLTLRSSLAKWLGAEYKPQELSQNRPPPPARGTNPRTNPSSSHNLPNNLDAKTLGNILLSQTDASLSRLKLFQISSLPDAAGRSAVSQEVNLELPFSFGSENSIIRFQILRDKGNNAQQNNKDWAIFFALNLQQLGEVGAKITYKAGRVGAIIWAEEEASAQLLNRLLPELSQSLEARGLETSFIKIRHGAINNKVNPTGKLLDDML